MSKSARSKRKKKQKDQHEVDSSGSQSPGPRIGSDVDAISEKIMEEAIGSDNEYQLGKVES